MFTGQGARDLKAWLTSEAELARSNEGLAKRFVEQCRATQTILPGTTVIERLCADVLVAAERRIEGFEDMPHVCCARSTSARHPLQRLWWRQHKLLHVLKKITTVLSPFYALLRNGGVTSIAREKMNPDFGRWL